ncbi:MAG TPA: lipid-transfer protein, partial [Phenylobacterium sp.]|nr:lipid-transfer protein [Phenylobacterium sp.]
ATAAAQALADAGIDYPRVGQAYAGYAMGDSTCGQSALYRLGFSGAPIFNVNNYCATGSTALFLARQAVASGVTDCALAVGFEQMVPGPIGMTYADREPTLGLHAALADRVQGQNASAPFAAQYFGGAGREYAAKWGTQLETFAMISVKARRHAASNPFAIFREPISVEAVLASKPMYGPLTRLQCCPPSCGAAAAVVVSASLARKLGVAGVRIRAQAMTTDEPGALDGDSMIGMVGYGMAARAAEEVYGASGLGPDEVDVVELHDCFTANEILSYEALGLVGPGEAERFVQDGHNTYGGRIVTNPSGGLLSKGHPLGATGLAQCAELVWQLRGQAGARQVEGARLALQHNLGLGGACVVSLYSRD